MHIIIRDNTGDTQAAWGCPGQSVLDVLRAAGVPVLAPCSGKGTCGNCNVIVRDSRGVRSVQACRTPAEEGMVVSCDRSLPLEAETAFDSGLPPLAAEASFDSGLHQGAEDALESGLHQAPETPFNDSLPPLAAKAALESNPASSQIQGKPSWGVAIDVGTTSLAFYLVNTATGKVKAAKGCVNPQITFGSDVVARIDAAHDPAHFKLLCSLLRDAIEANIAALCQEAGIPPEALTEACLVGNTAMQHFAAGLDPTGLGAFPFAPASLFGKVAPLFCGGAQTPRNAFFAPAVSAYFGGDATAGLAATKLATSTRPCLFVDVGTNAEMAIGNKERILCCSAAAGPAFEGAGIRFGMPSLPGAICAVAKKGAGFALTLVKEGDNRLPLGLCGSGILDAMACLRSADVLDEDGLMLDAGKLAPAYRALRSCQEGEELCYLDAARGVFVTQADVRGFQLAKGAIRAGIEVLLERYGADFGDIGEFYLAGGFGAHLDLQSAADIGLFPAQLAHKAMALGNAAGKGAVWALCSQAHRSFVLETAHRCEHLELSFDPLFTEAFLGALRLAP
ncbi:MAG: ASKHA domain-containing protein [Coriobacteriaceae bacterium]|jgi:uncharacterized 2Fe-2S/4Fe-4S cluster protein (DUF4445 family)|nr:ASKHA domain-containing protein [Coriobacteriaceae bacterium]